MQRFRRAGAIDQAAADHDTMASRGFGQGYAKLAKREERTRTIGLPGDIDQPATGSIVIVSSV